MNKRTISTRTRTGITKLQALEQMKKATSAFKKEIAKILEDNDLFYCVDTDIKNRVSKTNRCVDNMVYALLSEKSIVHAMIKCDLKTRKEALEFGYY
jgi:hypothetical protein